MVVVNCGIRIALALEVPLEALAITTASAPLPPISGPIRRPMGWMT